MKRIKFVFIFLLASIITFWYASETQCNETTICGLSYSISVLFFFSSLCIAVISTISNPPSFKKILRFSVYSLLVGLLLALMTWPVTYITYYIPCKNGSLNCIEPQEVGFISFTNKGALEKLNNSQNLFKDESMTIFSRGTPWPGLFSYYDYLALRENSSENFLVTSESFNYETLTNAIFTYSYLVLILLSVYYFIRRVWKKGSLSTNH